MKVYKVISVAPGDNIDNESIVKIIKTKKGADMTTLEESGMFELGNIEKSWAKEHGLDPKKFNWERDGIYITYFNLSDEWMDKGFVNDSDSSGYGNLREMTIKAVKMKDYIKKL